jgi:hypothetical protein
MTKRGAFWLAGLLLAAVLCFYVLARRPEIAPIEPPAASSFAPDRVARGEVLATAGNCARIVASMCRDIDRARSESSCQCS